jgi:hypothetical protein
MAAPTKTAKREESSCQLGAVHTWHLADMDFASAKAEPLYVIRSQADPEREYTAGGSELRTVPGAR